MPSRESRRLEKELQFSRSGCGSWGREVVTALDRDLAGRLLAALKNKKHLGAHIDAQVTKQGYGGYTWSVHMHKFLGRQSLLLSFLFCHDVYSRGHSSTYGSASK